ncbi:hypothetical protein RchiOBHm_Chr6g0251391 [Rosa chinensis]|uniref:Uncharacterized protein n=1 Tax=Rosa chinensis TaxID=74649 RepID=A0A2P6PKS9_ROSCH|nr:hypothetical protein RchiOBHm_Chr6g0251391 [Rosa chinensis]
MSCVVSLCSISYDSFCNTPKKIQIKFRGFFIIEFAVLGASTKLGEVVEAVEVVRTILFSKSNVI